MGRLIFVGLGLWGLHDLTQRGVEAIRAADEVVVEFYTSRLVGASLPELESFAGRAIRVLSRADVETSADAWLAAAKTKRIVFLAAGDSMTATTHQDLKSRAESLGIVTEIIPGVSILTAAPAAAGLQSYKFGRTTTVPFSRGAYRPQSPYDVIRQNRERGLHTLVLLDIDAENNRYLTAREAVATLQAIEAEVDAGVVTPETGIVGLARVGSPEARIVYAPAADWAHIDLGPPLHCLIVPGSLHFQEETALERAVAQRKTTLPHD